MAEILDPGASSLREDRSADASHSSPQAGSTIGGIPSARAWFGVLDKSEWERGPWDDEPDKVQWRDEATGLPCLIVRQRRGNLCGYVGVAPGHPWHGVDYDGCRTAPNEDGDDWPDIHGGLTFAGACQHGNDPSRGICHIPESGEPDDVWWLGFDCAHAWDYSSMGDTPEWRVRWQRDPDERYRDLPYVQRECKRLAAQAIEARSGETREAGLDPMDESAVGSADAPNPELRSPSHKDTGLANEP